MADAMRPAGERKRQIKMKVYVVAHLDGRHDYAVAATSQRVAALLIGTSMNQFRQFLCYAQPAAGLLVDADGLRPVADQPGIVFRRQSSVWPRPPWEVLTTGTPPAEGRANG